MKHFAILAIIVALAACDTGQNVPSRSMVAAIGNSDGSVVQQVNAIRRTRGLAPVRYSARLERIAAAHARDMARGGYFSHKGRDGSTPGQRLARAGYAFCVSAENIARGQPDLNSVMATWRRSGGHLRNMTNRDIRALGLARAAGDVWVMVLAAPQGSC